MELWLNILHYFFIYKVDFKLHILSNKFNPLLFIGKIPAVRRKFEELRTSLKEIGNRIWTDKRYGFGIMISGGGLVIILFFLNWATYLILNSRLKNPINFSWLSFIICMGAAYTICHYLVFQNDKYIEYFRKIDKWSKKQKWRYGWWSFVFVVGVIALFFYSFKFLPPIPPPVVGVRF